MPPMILIPLVVLGVGGLIYLVRRGPSAMDFASAGASKAKRESVRPPAMRWTELSPDEPSSRFLAPEDVTPVDARIPRTPENEDG